MNRGRHGRWVYIMTDRYRGTMYVGVTAHPAARIARVEKGNPEWRDLFDTLM